MSAIKLCSLLYFYLACWIFLKYRFYWNQSLIRGSQFCPLFKISSVAQLSQFYRQPEGITFPLRFFRLLSLNGNFPRVSRFPSCSQTNTYLKSHHRNGQIYYLAIFCKLRFFRTFCRDFSFPASKDASEKDLWSNIASFPSTATVLKVSINGLQCGKVCS